MSKNIYIRNIRDPLSFPLIQYPVAFFDFLWVSIIYSICSFSLAVLIDGHLLPPFDYSYTEKESTLVLAIQVLLQLAFQGFIAIMLLAILRKVPSPVKGIAGYNSHSSLGILLRTPAIIVLPFYTAVSIETVILAYLYTRINKIIQ